MKITCHLIKNPNRKEADQLAINKACRTKISSSGELRSEVGSIFAGYVPLAFHNPCPIIAFSWSILWPIIDPTLVTFGQMISLLSKSWKRVTHSSNYWKCPKGQPHYRQSRHENATPLSITSPVAHFLEVSPIPPLGNLFFASIPLKISGEGQPISLQLQIGQQWFVQ